MGRDKQLLHRLAVSLSPYTPHKLIIKIKKMSKKVAEVIIDEKEPIVEKPASVKKAEFKALIDAYKIQNPVKYEAKKEALKAKLESL